MRQLWRRLLGGSFFLYPPLMHLLIVRGMVVAALAGLVLVCVGAVAAQVLERRAGFAHTLPYAIIAAAALVSLAGGRTTALYLPPIVFNVALALVFGRTLRAEATPLIERFMRLHQGEEVPAAMLRYARQLTRAWTVFFVAMALTAVVLAAFASLEAWSLFANVVNYLLVAALFVAQFVYGAVRFRSPRLGEIVPTVVRVARGVAARQGVPR
jgi:uncharacterized membrane protein